MSDDRAVVRVIDGKLVLDDPTALGVIRAVEKHNCRLTAQENFERVNYFKGRVVFLSQPF